LASPFYDALIIKDNSEENMSESSRFAQDLEKSLKRGHRSVFLEKKV
jgi:hypothetical protein